MQKSLFLQFAYRYRNKLLFLHCNSSEDVIFASVKEVEYLIVGLGLAGLAFAEYCDRASKTFMVIDQGGDGASRVAAGLYNPVILKRYSLPWKSIEQFDLALDFYGALEKKLGIAIKEKLAVQKVFSSPEDQNNWYAASDRPGLSRFIQTPIVNTIKKQVRAPYNYGEVAETGRIHIKNLQTVYEKYLLSINSFCRESFDHDKIAFTEQGVTYKNFRATRIVFCEGYGLKKNPYFKGLPLVGNKGEYLIIKAPELKVTVALKSSFFVVPLGNDLYKVGATFNWADKDSIPTREARDEIVKKLATLIDTPYTIVHQEAGIRPTTGDRRALVGRHPKFKQLYVLNGLGTRGIMAAPLLAQYLFNFIEEGTLLCEEIDCMRFPKKF